MEAEALCVLCRRPVNPAWRPFCSERCKLLDLARWVSGRYRIPGEPIPSRSDEDPINREDERTPWRASRK